MIGSYSAALQRCAAYGLDRGFDRAGQRRQPVCLLSGAGQRRTGYRLLRVALEHAQLHEATGDRRPGRFLAMRKHLGWYAPRWVPAASAAAAGIGGEGTTAAEVAALLDAYFLQRRTSERPM
jgi:hypothetical protein